MDAGFRNKLLAYLAGAAVALGAEGIANAQVVLQDIPGPVIEDLLTDVEADDWEEQDLLKLVELLSKDPRASVRRQAAELLSTVDPEAVPESVEELLEDLVQDRSELVRGACSSTLASWLGKVGGLARIKTIAEWTLSLSPQTRLTMAEALDSDVEALGVDSAVLRLALDDDFRVRAAAAKAAGRRLRENPASYATVLRDLLSDEHRLVRRSARRALNLGTA